MWHDAVKFASLQDAARFANPQAGNQSVNILGISAYYHDSPAALVRDGVIVAAAQEERFTRKKHDYRFPQHTIDYCLREAGLREAGLGMGRLHGTWVRSIEVT